MKQRTIAIVLLILLLTGCSAEIPEQEHELGTTSENITNSNGRYAMANGFVYIDRENYIVEFDLETGKAITLSMPDFDNDKNLSSSFSRGNLFLLQGNVVFRESRWCDEMYEDEYGKMRSVSYQVETASIMGPNGGNSSPISELGERVYSVVPVKKTGKPENGELESDKALGANNRLAGLDIYYYFGYDTFPEQAALLASDGIILEEPVDPNERNRYIIPALGYLDGDTGKSVVLTKNFNGGFFLDDEYIYITRTGTANEIQLYRSRRDQIDFQFMDLGMIANRITPCEGGFYFIRYDSWQLCRYQEGEIIELPIASSSFMQWRDQLIYQDMHWKDSTAYGAIKSYDLKTGEIQNLCENAEHRFCILDNKYLACRQVTDTCETDFLIDLETGERIEMYRTEVS